MQRVLNISSQMTGEPVAQESSTISYAGSGNNIGIISLFNEKTYNALTPDMRESIIKNVRILEAD